MSFKLFVIIILSFLFGWFLRLRSGNIFLGLYLSISISILSLSIHWPLMLSHLECMASLSLSYHGLNHAWLLDTQSFDDLKDVHHAFRLTVLDAAQQRAEHTTASHSVPGMEWNGIVYRMRTRTGIEKNQSCYVTEEIIGGNIFFPGSYTCTSHLIFECEMNCLVQRKKTT